MSGEIKPNIAERAPENRLQFESQSRARWVKIALSASLNTQELLSASSPLSSQNASFPPSLICAPSFVRRQERVVLASPLLQPTSSGRPHMSMQQCGIPLPLTMQTSRTARVGRGALRAQYRDIPEERSDARGDVEFHTHPVQEKGLGRGAFWTHVRYIQEERPGDREDSTFLLTGAIYNGRMLGWRRILRWAF